MPSLWRGSRRRRIVVSAARVSLGWLLWRRVWRRVLVGLVRLLPIRLAWIVSVRVAVLVVVHISTRLSHGLTCRESRVVLYPAASAIATQGSEDTRPEENA